MPRYPTRKLLDLVGDKRTPVVPYSLSDSTKRFSDLQRDIPDISKVEAFALRLAAARRSTAYVA